MTHDNVGLISDVIALAWADDVSFDEIKQRYGLTESDVIRLMRTHLKSSSFKLWRARVSGRKTKHRKLMREFNQPNDVDDDETLERGIEI